jgi:uncharacterized membrane protein/rhamnogalacturonyl hydrolase YesR
MDPTHGIARGLISLLAVAFLSLNPGSFIAQSDEDGSHSARIDPAPIISPSRGGIENPYIAHAEAGARWLISIAEEPSVGVYKWYSSDLKNDYYYLEQSEGAVGIGKFLLQLYNVTGNSTYLEYAKGAGRWIISQAVTESPDSCKWSYVEGLPYYGADYYGGQGSMVEYLLMLYQVTGESTFLTYAKKGAEWLMDTAVPVGEGHKWETIPGGNYNMTGWYHGTAGISYVFLELYQATGNETYLDVCLKGAGWLMDIAKIPAPDQYSWVRVETDTDPSIVWCGGTTGIVQFFLELYEATGNTTYLDYAKGGGNWMISQADQVRPGNVSFFGTNMFCHGDPSSAWIMFWLYSQTGNAIYRQYGEMTMNWIISQKEDLSGNRTTWASLPGGDEYNTGLMMGVSGIGHAFILSDELLGTRGYTDLALRAANWIGDLAVETSPGVEKWNYMEKIDSTEEYCTGWYWGVAGIGQFMLEVAPYWERPLVHDLQILGETSISIGPGETMSSAFYVRNVGDLDLIPQISMDGADEGWNVSLDFETSSLKPGQVIAGTLSVAPPIDAVAGDKLDLTIQVSCEEDPSVSDSMMIKAILSPEYRLTLMTGDRSDHVGIGGTCSFPLSVMNTGSLVDTYSMEVPPITEWMIIYYPEDLKKDNPPGAKLSTFIEVTLQEPLPPGETMDLNVTISSDNDPNVKRSVYFSIMVDRTPIFEVLKGDKTVYTSLGEYAEVNFTMMNTGNVDEIIKVNVTGYPETWRVAYSSVNKVPPGKSTLLNISVTPKPPNWSADLNVTFDDGISIVTRHVTVFVDPIYDVEIIEDHIVLDLADTDIGFCTISVKNNGTASDDITIENSVGSTGWGIEIDFNGTDMAPGEVRQANIRIERPLLSPVYAANISFIAMSKVSPLVSDSIWVMQMVRYWATLKLNVDDMRGGPDYSVDTYIDVNWTGNFIGRIKLQISTENGWNVFLVNSGSVLTVTPEKHLYVPVRVFIPSDAIAGSIEYLMVTATSVGDPVITASCRAMIQVGGNTAFEMSADRTSVSMYNGEKATFKITLTNKGNIEFPVTFSISGFERGSLDLENDTVILQRNGSVQITLTATPDKHTIGKWTFTLQGNSEDHTRTIDFDLWVEDREEVEQRTTARTFLLIGIVGLLVLIPFTIYVIRKRGESPEE